MNDKDVALKVQLSFPQALYHDWFYVSRLGQDIKLKSRQNYKINYVQDKLR